MDSDRAKELTHDRLGPAFAGALSDYDTQRRIGVLIDDFLGGMDLSGQRVLDVGCGLGFFSQRLVERGAVVTACDIGPSLVAATRDRAGCTAVVADAVRLADSFAAGSFDIVVSSECIEHTRDPDAALASIAGMARPGGWISLSTPNRLWYPVVRLATLCRLRPFDGHEHFSSFARIRRRLGQEGCRIEREAGLHLWPFQLPGHRLLRAADQLQALRGLMINCCVLAQRGSSLPGHPAP